MRDWSKPISKGKFCDYCPCTACQTGDEEWVRTAGRNYECADGTHICGVCLTEEPCGENGYFCDRFPLCEHKPKLAESELKKFR